MKLNDVYKKKAIQQRFKPFADFDDFCISEENAYDAMQSIRTAAPKASGSSSSNTESSSGRSGRNGSSRGRRGGNTSSSSSGRGEIVHYIPMKYNNLPKKNEPAETERIHKYNLCFSCCQPGHSAGAKQCVFSLDRSRFAFADIPCEMTKQQYEDFTRGRGTALHAINDYEDADNALPEPEDHLRIENA
ncbi:hypothetical protein Q7P36_007743 [Cladosporium allicinum]